MSQEKRGKLRESQKYQRPSRHLVVDGRPVFFGLRWEQNGCALRGTYTLNPAYTYNRQDGMDDLIIYLLQLISNGDFGSDFGFELVTSNSNGTILSGPNGPDGKFEHRSVFRRLLPWHKHTGIPHSRLARKRKADEMAAGSRQVES